MKQEVFFIGSTPAVLLGEKSDKIYIFIHGQSGSKAEASAFADVAAQRGFQVLGIDLPEHGGRSDGARLVPWEAVPELKTVMAYAKSNWCSVCVRANSIGAWLSMLAFKDEQVEKNLFVSPIIDMKKLIEDMMLWANVTEERLCARGEIATDFGQTLSYRYLCFARENPAGTGSNPTAILYGDTDNMTSLASVSAFADKFGCALTVMPGGEHWFHTPEQVDWMKKWEQDNL